jgi:hypothetical protein
MDDERILPRQPHHNIPTAEACSSPSRATQGDEASCGRGRDPLNPEPAAGWPDRRFMDPSQRTMKASVLWQPLTWGVHAWTR